MWVHFTKFYMYPESSVTKLFVAEVSVVGGPILIQQYRDLDQSAVATVGTEDFSCVAGCPVCVCVCVCVCVLCVCVLKDYLTWF